MSNNYLKRIPIYAGAITGLIVGLIVSLRFNMFYLIPFFLGFGIAMGIIMYFAIERVINIGIKARKRAEERR